MTREEILKRIQDEWLIMILRGDTAEEAEEVFGALVAGGATLLEVPFTTPNAGRVIRRLREKHGDKIVVTAGTITTVDEAREALDCGAQGIVSPNLYPPVVEFALRNGLLSVPGCVTPSEIADARRLNADLIKLFPCYNLGPEYIGFILGPFPGTRIAPAGRVTLENMRAWQDAGAFAGIVGVTTEMALLREVKLRDYERVAQVAGAFLKKAKEGMAGRRGGAARPAGGR